MGTPHGIPAPALKNPALEAPTNVRVKYSGSSDRPCNAGKYAVERSKRRSPTPNYKENFLMFQIATIFHIFDL